ncbi:MAG: kelch repeat-containing protein, partial [candidate division WOR-3 bacterium]
MRYIICLVTLATLVYGVGAERQFPPAAVNSSPDGSAEFRLPPSGNPELDAIIWTYQTPYPYVNGTHRAAACTDGSYYYLLGGWNLPVDPTAALASVYRYDPVTNSWTQMADMPGQNTNHVAIYHPGVHRIYVVGGYDFNVGAKNVNWEYNIATNTWTTKAPFPLTCYGTAGWAYGDYIYVTAGYGYSQFYRYNVYTNTWEELATRPYSESHGALVEVGGKLYSIGGWPRSENCAMYDPITNTWTTRATMPTNTGGHGLGVAPFVGKVYVYGGAWDGFPWVCLNAARVYDPLTNTWTSETPLLQVAGGSSISGGLGPYMYYTSSASYPNPPNFHMRGQFPDVHNVALTKIFAPAGAVDSGSTITPQVEIRNLGTYVENNFYTYMQIEGRPVEGVLVSSIGIGAADTLEFPDVTLHGRDSMGVTAWTYLSGDQIPADDTLSQKFLVRVKDVAVSQIMWPGPHPYDTLPPDTVLYPRCQVWNLGNQSQTFNVQFRIGAYENTVTVSNLLPGGARYVTALAPYTTVPGVWIHTVEAILAGDQHPDNNVLTDTFFVPGTVQHDVAAEAIVSPVGNIDTIHTVHCRARVANYGGDNETFWTWFSVTDTCTDRLVYRE